MDTVKVRHIIYNKKRIKKNLNDRYDVVKGRKGNTRVNTYLYMTVQ